MNIFSFGHAKKDAVGAGFSSTPTFDKWSGAPGLFTSRPSIAFLEQAQAAVSGPDEIMSAQSSLEITSRKSLANIATSKAALEKRFDSPLSASELFQIVDKAFFTVLDMQKSGKQLPVLFDDEKKLLRDRGVRLMELRSIAKLLRDKPETLPVIAMPLKPGSEWSNEFKKNVVTPYDVASTSLAKAVGAYGTRASNVAMVTSIPHKVINEIGDLAHDAAKQVPKALGLPAWFVPVLVGGAAVAAAASVVGSFKSYLPRGATT
jgi:hypothetical protein